MGIGCLAWKIGIILTFNVEFDTYAVVKLIYTWKLVKVKHVLFLHKLSKTHVTRYICC